jgi:hypothetical protein
MDDPPSVPLAGPPVPVEQTSRLDASRPSSLRLAGFLATTVGAALVGVGSVLNWAVIGVIGSHVLDAPIKGIDVWEGKVALAIGVLSLVGMIVMRVVGGSTTRRGIAGATVILGLFAVGLATGDAIRIRTRFGEDLGQLKKLAAALAGALGSPVSDVLRELQQRLSELVAFSRGPGLWLVIAGGLLLAIGGALSLAWANRQDRRPVSATEDVASETTDGDGGAIST